MLLSFQVRNAGLLENVSAEQRKFQEVYRITEINIVGVISNSSPAC